MLSTSNYEFGTPFPSTFALGSVEAPGDKPAQKAEDFMNSLAKICFMLCRSLPLRIALINDLDYG